MHNYDKCHANAAECSRMAALAIDPSDKIIWTQLADHWWFLSPKQGQPIGAESVVCSEANAIRYLGRSQA